MKSTNPIPFLATAVGLLTLAVPAPSSADPRPNVVVIVSDDHAWNDYGFMGHAHIQTPALDRLAAESITFRRGYSPVPLCRPALATILTGLHPHQHGVTGNDPALPEPGVNPQRGRADPRFAHLYRTIIENFQQRPNFVRDLTARGYRTLQTGKWWEGDPIRVGGFTHAMTQGEGPGGRHGDLGLDIGRKGLAAITDFIAAAGDQPWLVWYAPFLPHSPHTPPEDLLKKYLPLAPTEAVARYQANVEWFDRTCGELLEHLDQRGLRDDTIILYTTDNGWIQDPELVNRFEGRSKQSPYEGGGRTPILISWRGRLAPRMDDTHLASNIDLWPTLARLLGTSVPAGLPGIDLTDPQALARRTAIHGAAYAHDIADVDQPARSLTYRWIIDGSHKLIVPHPRNRPERPRELFDLRTDPHELHDLAAAQPERVRTLLDQLDAWLPAPAGR